MAKAIVLAVCLSLPKVRSLSALTAIYFLLAPVFPQTAPFEIRSNNQQHADGTIHFPESTQYADQQQEVTRNKINYERTTPSAVKELNGQSYNKEVNKTYKQMPSNGYQAEPTHSQFGSYQPFATDNRPYYPQNSMHNQMKEVLQPQSIQDQYPAGQQNSQGFVLNTPGVSAQSDTSQSNHNGGSSQMSHQHAGQQNGQGFVPNVSGILAQSDTSQSYHNGVGSLVANQHGGQQNRPNGQVIPNTQNIPGAVPQQTDSPQISHQGTGNRPVGTGGQVNYPSENTASAQIVPASANLISASVTGFGLSIMKAIDEEGAGNSVVSPFSVALVLALLQQGTDGGSQQQITRALRLTPAQAREQFRELVRSLQGRRSRNVLNIATSIFVSADYIITPQYREFAVHNFASSLLPVHFENSQVTARQINDWVSVSTAGNIPYLVSADAFDVDTQLVLANAVYFKGLWNSTFDTQRTVSRPFRLAGGASTPASFMHNSGKFQAGRDRLLSADWLVMPFEDLQYSLLVMVPTESHDVSALLLQLRAEDLHGYLRSPQRDVLISMPKFTVRIDTDLMRPLKALGIRDIFSRQSGLTALGSARAEHPRVTNALHTAVLNIDEQGGSAAAATLLAVSTLSLDAHDDEFRFKADRPFIAMLWDSQLNLPLFVAKIVDPTLLN